MYDVSVVMSVFNASCYVKEAIESILNQTYTDFEFIIINDGSTDNSLEIINSYPDSGIIVIDQKNQGLSKALNNGISLAKGKFIVRMDADDIADPNRIKEQIDFLNNNPNCVAVGSNAHYIDVKGNYLYTSNTALKWLEISQKLPESPFFHSSVTFRKNIWEKCGGYREDIVHHFEDKILWNQMAKFGELRNLANPLIQYRLVPSSLSNHNKKTINSLKHLSNKIIETDSFTEAEFNKLNSLLVISEKEKNSNYHLQLGRIFLNQNFNRKLAAIHILQSIKLNPLKRATWISVLMWVLPKAWVSKIKTVIRG